MQQPGSAAADAGKQGAHRGDMRQAGMQQQQQEQPQQEQPQQQQEWPSKRTARPRTGWSCPQTSTQCRRCSAPATQQGAQQGSRVVKHNEQRPGGCTDNLAASNEGHNPSSAQLRAGSINIRFLATATTAGMGPASDTFSSGNSTPSHSCTTPACHMQDAHMAPFHPSHRQHPLLLGPDAGAVGPGGGAHAPVKQLLPVGRVKAGQRLHVVLRMSKAAGKCMACQRAAAAGESSGMSNSRHFDRTKYGDNGLQLLE